MGIIALYHESVCSVPARDLLEPRDALRHGLDHKISHPAELLQLDRGVRSIERLASADESSHSLGPVVTRGIKGANVGPRVGVLRGRRVRGLGQELNGISKNNMKRYKV